MIIPYLRQDLEILRGNSREDGSPAWLLYDAIRNKYFTIGLTAFKLIKNWHGGEDIDNFQKKISSEGLETSSDEIKNFIDDIGDILSEIDYEHLRKFLKICSQRAYNFRNQTPMPSLGDCMNTMIRDQNTLDPNSKYYHLLHSPYLQQKHVLLQYNLKQK